MSASDSLNEGLVVEQVFTHFLIQNLVFRVERGHRHYHDLWCLSSNEVTKVAQFGTIIDKSIRRKTVFVFQLPFEILKRIYGSLTDGN